MNVQISFWYSLVYKIVENKKINKLKAKLIHILSVKDGQFKIPDMLETVIWISITKAPLCQIYCCAVPKTICLKFSCCSCFSITSHLNVFLYYTLFFLLHQRCLTETEYNKKSEKQNFFFYLKIQMITLKKKKKDFWTSLQEYLHLFTT